ncbi:MAG: PDZ domain-containing protein [Pelosinus sp.]|nr:PDZ domain-containing protein [Pelosinus sp.]
MARRKGSNTGIPGLSFSPKRALGISKAQSKLSRELGIPLSKSGRQRKMGAAMGCLLPILLTIVLTLLLSSIVAFAATPQVTINDAKKSDVMAAIVPEMTTNGFSVKAINEYSVTFSQYKDNFWASVFTGSTSFEARMTYNVIEVGNNVLVTANAQIVSFPGTAREQISPANDQINGQIQIALDRLRIGFDGGYFYGFDFEGKSKYWKIVGITPGGAFDQAGIKPGSKIMAINGISLSQMNTREINVALSGGEGAHAIFTIEKDGQSNNYTIAKYYIAPKYKKSKIITPVTPI